MQKQLTGVGGDGSASGGSGYESSGSPERSRRSPDLGGRGLKVPKLCGDCDQLSYCQYARNLSHNHAANFNSHKIINTAIEDQPSKLNVPDQHIMAERLKLRYKTCPFHRELSLGSESRTVNFKSEKRDQSIR